MSAGRTRDAKLAINISEVFGKVAECDSMAGVLSYLSGVPDSAVLSLKQAAGYGMVLKALQRARPRSSYQEAQILLDELVASQAELDAIRPENRTVQATTRRIIETTRVFLEANTIPCTEWPATQEMAEFILQEASEIIRS
jgi:hypothetical protein